MEDRQAFAAGMDLAQDLIDRTGVRDPERLLEVAELVESRAETAMEMGVAAGLRIAAAEIADECALQ